MTEAASHLEKLAANDVPPANLLDVHYCIVAPGPAVGPGRHGLVRRGQCLAPAPWPKASPSQNHKFIDSLQWHHSDSR